MFNKILIANRGEIAVRIIRACREMGIKTVAVFSEPDREALHTQLADEAVCIGSAKVGDSYLDMNNIISAAVEKRAQAIHPGFGFLSENSMFAGVCKDCNIKFIGPKGSVIDALGNKANARQMMINAGVPVIPGSDGVIADVDGAYKMADKLGYPVIVKASAGGGGKGIRIVRKKEDLKEAFLSAEELENTYEISDSHLQDYCEKLTGYIQASKRNQIAETLHELEHNLFNSTSDISRIKLFLTDLYLSIKEKISHLYHNANIAFPGNAEIIDYIGSKYYLYEIMLYFTEQFDMITRTIGNPTSEGVMDDIIHYIEHNYMDNIKLENIAPLFGYNSSYLGKIFNKKVGEGFNIFVDKVRIKHSKELLLTTDLKVYEIAEKVGYKNVDYFHTKFKKYVEMSPAEFRKKNKDTI